MTKKLIHKNQNPTGNTFTPLSQREIDTIINGNALPSSTIPSTDQTRQQADQNQQNTERYHQRQRERKPDTREVITIVKPRTTEQIVKSEHPTPEVSTQLNTAAGVLSPVDPIGEFFVATAALNPVFDLAGKAVQYGLGRYGSGQLQNWARGKILSNALDRNMTGSIPYEVVGERTPYGLYKFTQSDGTIRLRLPEHTSAKPREIKIDPKKGEGYNIHMRTWDDPVNRIPANISSQDKQLLFSGLTEELPEGTVINIPESGPDFLATRGTIAGIKRLERSPLFEPGQQTGTVMYQGKNGVEVYPTTSFVKISSQDEMPIVSAPKEISPTDKIINYLSDRKSNNNLGAFNPGQQQYINLLKQWGVDVDKLSSSDISTLMTDRLKSLETNLPQGRVMLTADLPRPSGAYWTEGTMYENGKEIATVSARKHPIKGYYKIDNISSTSDNVHHVTEDAYNGLIESLQQNGLFFPIRSGEELLSPEKHYRIWRKFPTQHVGNYGLHSFGSGRGLYTTDDAIREITDGPVVDILGKSQRSTIPIKSAYYVHPDMIEGKTMLPPNWRNNNIFKTLLYGLGTTATGASLLSSK